MSKIEAGLKAADSLLSIGDNLTSADQQQLRAFVRSYKKISKAVNTAESIFIGKIDTAFIGDNSFHGTDQIMLPKKKYRAYWLLREKFNRLD